VDDLDPAVRALLETWDGGGTPPADEVRDVVKATLQRLVKAAPGRSVEVRIPPYAAVQAVPGVVHRRGTPTAVVETDARTWLELACGDLPWAEAVQSGRLVASGERSDLSGWLPLTGR
jgi:hypothetical protein